MGYYMIKTGLVSATFRRLIAEEVLETAVEAGLDAIEWSSDVHVLPGDREQARKMKEMCRKRRIEVCGYASYYRLGEHDDPCQAFKPVLISAQELEAPIIRIWAGGQPSGKISSKRFAQMAEEAAVLVRAAREIQAEISFEYHRNTLTDTRQSALQLLESVPGSRTHWQTAPGAGAEENIRAIRQLAPYITTVHVQNCIDGVYYPLSEGREVWKRYLKEIGKLPGIHYACLEFVKDGSTQQAVEDGKILAVITSEV